MKNNNGVMKRIVFQMVDNSEQNVEHIPYHSYGILAKTDEDELFLNDIAGDKEWVSEICERLNHEEVSLCHFKDVVYDLLCSKMSV